MHLAFSEQRTPTQRPKLAPPGIGYTNIDAPKAVAGFVHELRYGFETGYVQGLAGDIHLKTAADALGRRAESFLTPGAPCQADSFGGERRRCRQAEPLARGSGERYATFHP